jgi:hypothetical protein
MSERVRQCKNKGKKSKRRRWQTIQEERRRGRVPRHGKGGNGPVFVEQTPKKQR